MAQPSIMIAPETNYTGLDRILFAMGEGPSNFGWGPQVVSKLEPATVVGRIALDMGASAQYAAALRSMAENQTLPEIAGEWGVGGVIDATEAQTALIGFRVFTAAGGNINSTEWVDMVLDGLGLMLKPDDD